MHIEYKVCELWGFYIFSFYLYFVSVSWALVVQDNSAEEWLSGARFTELQGKMRTYYVEKKKHKNSCPWELVLQLGS